MKYRLQKALAVLAFLLATGFVAYDSLQEYTFSDNATDNMTVSDNVSYFKSTSDIREWVKSTGIPDRRYSKDYDCDDFAIDLWKAALADGKPVGLYTQVRYKDGRLVEIHMMNFTFKGNYAYQIEPQTGNVNPLAGYNVKLD